MTPPKMRVDAAGAPGARFEVVGHPEGDAADREGHRRHAERVQHVGRRPQQHEIVGPGDAGAARCGVRRVPALRLAP